MKLVFMLSLSLLMALSSAKIIVHVRNETSDIISHFDVIFYADASHGWGTSYDGHTLAVGGIWDVYSYDIAEGYGLQSKYFLDDKYDFIDSYSTCVVHKRPLDDREINLTAHIYDLPEERDGIKYAVRWDCPVT